MQELLLPLCRILPFQIGADKIEITKLFGQASSRQYFRVTFKDHNQSFVLMKMPQGFSSPAEEITKTAPSSPQEFPFLNVQKYLTEQGVKVPQIHGVEAESGLILLQDLGDQTLETVLAAAEGDFFLFYYKKVIDLLIDLQKKTLSHPAKTCVAYHRHFDADLLNWEFDHFLEYGIEDALKTKVSEADREIFKIQTRKITKLITEMPQGFVHRDFQSRNLMFYAYGFYLIDFQDALIGPVLYDLVALTRDSYILIDQQQLKTLLKYYSERLFKEHPYSHNEEKLNRDFFLITLQRKLKDYGRFQFILTKRGNPNFLQHMPLTLVYIKLALKVLPEFSELKEMIGRYLKI